MKKELVKKENLEGQIIITIEKEDYKEEFENELKKVSGKVQMKGFRKGRTPKNMVSRMYGPSVLQDILNKKIEAGLVEFIGEEKMDLLGQPLPSLEQDQPDLSISNLQDYTFKFDVGFTPELELKWDHTFQDYFLKVEDSFVEDELFKIRKQSGKQISVTEDIAEEDIVTLNIKELDENGEPKSKGLESAFDLYVKTTKEEYKDLLLGKKVGDEIKVDLFELEKNVDEQFVKKHYLKFEEDEMEKSFNQHFTEKIVDIKRLEPAELNKEFFNSAFGEEINTEDEAREKILEINEKSFETQSNMLLLRKVQDYALENFVQELPDEFLKRWLVSVNEKTTKEQVDVEYDNEIRKSFKWSVIKNNLTAKYGITVGQEEVANAMRDRVRQYMGNYGMDENFFNQMVARMMQNQQQVEEVYNDLEVRKVIAALKPDLSLEKQGISFEELGKKFEEVQKQDKSEEE